jgi:hypothetical protein
MKHVVTDLNDPNEPVMFNHSILGNYSVIHFLGITVLKFHLMWNQTHNLKSFIALRLLSPTVTYQIQLIMILYNLT